jgi:predicted PurR-regulated permease PerM
MVPSTDRTHWFFYGVFGFALFLLWLFLQPVLLSIIVAALLSIILYPLYTFLNQKCWPYSPAFNSFLSVMIALLCIVLPIVGLFALLVAEALSLYRYVSVNGVFFDTYVTSADVILSRYIPDFSINLQSVISSVSQWLVLQLGSLFSSSLALLLHTIIILFTTFYLLRDGRKFVSWLISVSPLADSEDEFIVSRTRTAIVAIVRGLFLVAILQGLCVSLGFLLFGVPNPILWGSVTALFALIPGVGTPLIILPAVAYLYLSGHLFAAVGLLVWGAVTVIVVENIVSPMLMSYGHSLHPLLILLSVIGGISLVGVIGVILGPVLMSVVVTLFDVLQQRRNAEVKIAKVKSVKKTKSVPSIRKTKKITHDK